MPAYRAASPQCVWGMGGEQPTPTAAAPAVYQVWGGERDQDHLHPHAVVAAGPSPAQVLRPPFGVIMLGEGGHNHPLALPGQRQHRAPNGNAGVLVPTATGTGEDHSFPLPQQGEREVLQGLGLWPAPEGHRAMGDEGVTESP